MAAGKVEIVSREIQTHSVGEIDRVAGPVVTATGIRPRMYDVCFVGKEELMGEVIQIAGEKTIIQVYEDTSGVRPGEKVIDTGAPLVAELGPGLLSSIYDGIQRPLPVLRSAMGDYIRRGVRSAGLDYAKQWDFVPAVKAGQTVGPGSVLGTVKEFNVEHRILVPPRSRGGKVADIRAGKARVTETVCTLDTGEKLTLKHEWPVRQGRPVKERLMPTIPLVTGQRVFDFLFPLAKGGTAAIPGGFGTGKCVVGTTPVFLSDGSLVPIKTLYERLRGAGPDQGEENLVRLRSPLGVLTFDGQRIRKGQATAVYRGKTSKITDVRLRSGRSVRLTPVHKLFRFNGTSVVETPAAELKPDDAVLVPRAIPAESHEPALPLPAEARVADSASLLEVSRKLRELGRAAGPAITARRLGISKSAYWNYCLKRTAPRVALAERLGVQPSIIRTERASRSIRVPRRMTADLAEFLGLQLSEGMIKGGRVVEFYNNDVQLRKRYIELLGNLFGLRGRERHDPTVSTVTVGSRALVQVLWTWGVPLRKKSRTAGLVEALGAASPEVIGSFLRAYAEGDGHFADEGLEIVTASESMASALSYLFARLGVFARVKVKRAEGWIYHRVWVSPSEGARFFEALRRERYYDSFDVIQVPPDQVSAIRTALGAKASGWTQELKNAASGQRMSRRTLREIRQAISEDTAVGAWLGSLDTMLDWVLLDRVVDVRTWDETTDVYDLTVEETHNFVGGHLPMLLHNTVSEQQLSKWCDAQIVVYIGCGERGNEMTEMLELFPKLEDPKTGRPLMERTVMIANTSNMPVAAREASVYTGITLAEYYRDMGYHVALMADSTSRWAEAMREISSRLEEMPGEEGFPAYLSARLSEFYERAGRATALNGLEGSVSVVGAVSPSGGDFSEPVTQGTLRIVKVFWALDTALRARRHFPAVNWLTSYSLYGEILEDWFRKNVHEDYPKLRAWASRTLQEEAELEEIVRLVGADALPEDQQLTLDVARLIREVVLQQNAYHKVDTFCPPERTFKIISTIKQYEEAGKRALALEVPLREITSIKARELLVRVKYEEQFDEELRKLTALMDEEFKKMEVR